MNDNKTKKTKNKKKIVNQKVSIFRLLLARGILFVDFLIRLKKVITVLYDNALIVNKISLHLI